ncbi:MAG TPA: NAD(P)(+) transhydrogenase (Re/Si-specific) subunit beta, partial [Phycisphaerae bacterium]|nr:NAD(P)(+) transhydrogenase (Re/Si-specific) subunit beta [Phycisphaerae bacterium]
NVFAGLRPADAGLEAGPATRAEAITPSRTCLENSPLPAEPLVQPETMDPFSRAIEAVRSAQSVIIVPGYGMALADAQETTVRLAERLASMGKSVLFAIHPVAGRMPGHMHVLLAEAEVDYGMIRELKDVNPQFAQTDLALIVGACDVVNPAAIESQGTPISGMPILLAHEAGTVIVCNLDDRPGYSGVENPLYRQPRTILLLGDAKETLARLFRDLV